jgi:sugar phosphate isomerase/epimerase
LPDPVISVFTKPWTDPLPALADKLAALGVDGVELAVRPGYQVTPETAAAGLKDAVGILGARGLRILSIASVADEATIAACGDAGVPLIRIMAPIDMTLGYLGSVTRLQRRLDALLPALDRYGVTIGVQNHYGLFVGSAVGLLHLLQPFDRRLVCAVLDMAHCAVDGEPVALAVDIVKDRLNGLVNFKSAYHARVSNPEDEAVFAVKWTTHRYGGYSWREFARALDGIGYAGTYCLPAEYSDPLGKPQRMGDDVLPYLREDLAHLRAVLAEAPNRA